MTSVSRPSAKRCPLPARRRVRGQIVALLVVAFLSTIAHGHAAEARKNTARPAGVVCRLVVTRGNHLAVQGAINGRALRFIVDTACPVTIIDSAVYAKLTLPGGQAPVSGPTFYSKSYNYRPAAIGYAADLSIGESDLGRVPVGVTALDPVLGKDGGEADGILGTDALLRCRAVIDLKSGTLLLNPTAGQTAALAVGIAREDYTIVAMAPTSGLHLAVPCQLGNASRRLVVDTGSPATVLQRELLRSADLIRPRRVGLMRTLTGVTTVAWIPLSHWSIGDFPVADVMVATGNFRGGIYAERTRDGGQIAGLLGLESLAYWHAIVDFGSRKIYLRRRGTGTTLTRDTALAQHPFRGSVPVSNTISQQPRQTKSR